MSNFWFKSDLFEIEQGEDEEVNPRIYGRQLANWLKVRLEQMGYEVEPVIAEDWGRCLMLSRSPFMLWVGCGNMMEYSNIIERDPLPAMESVVWLCFAEVEVAFWKRLFKKPNTSPALNKLTADLAAIFAAEPRITLVQEP